MPGTAPGNDPVRHGTAPHGTSLVVEDSDVAAARSPSIRRPHRAVRLPIARDAYIVGGMADLYEVEVEPEVRSWLQGLTDRDFGRVDFLVGLLSERAETLGEPNTRHLDAKVRELRFHLLRRQTRVTYWLAPARRVVLLTVFHKTRSAETAEVQRAARAQRTCEATHDIAHDVYERERKSR